MFHNHDFATAASRPPLPRIPDAKPMTPSEYIRLRRLAAKLSEHDLAKHMAAFHVTTAEYRPGLTMLDLSKAMLMLLRSIELPGAVARRPKTITALAADRRPEDPRPLPAMARRTRKVIGATG